jgi:hypothetical protein
MRAWCCPAGKFSYSHCDIYMAVCVHFPLESSMLHKTYIEPDSLGSFPLRQAIALYAEIFSLLYWLWRGQIPVTSNTWVAVRSVVCPESYTSSSVLEPKCFCLRFSRSVTSDHVKLKNAEILKWLQHTV